MCQSEPSGRDVDQLFPDKPLPPRAILAAQVLLALHGIFFLVLLMASDEAKSQPLLTIEAVFVYGTPFAVLGIASFSSRERGARARLHLAFWLCLSLLFWLLLLICHIGVVVEVARVRQYLRLYHPDLLQGPP